MFETETRETRAWLAGLYEGEGTVTLNSKTFRSRVDGVILDRKSRTMQLRINMTDLDVIERAQEVLGGNIHHATPKAAHHKPNYVLYLGRVGEVMTAIGMMWPWLGERRREQAKTVLLAWRG